MQSLTLYQKLVDLSDWLFPVVDNFPKREKFALCTQIKNSLYGLVRDAIRFQKSRDKMKWLFRLDTELEMLKFLICGYRVWATHKLLRKRSIRRMKSQMQKLEQQYANGCASLQRVNSTVASWVGHARHADSYRTRQSVLGNVILKKRK